MSLGHENRNIDALHKNIVFLQNELAKKNKMIKSLMEVLDVMTDLREQQNTPEQNITEHLPQDKLNKRSHNYRNKDYSREKRYNRNQSAGNEKKKNVLWERENVTEGDLV